jgi:hypothetical protein
MTVIVPPLADHTACLGPNPQKFESIEEFNPLLTFSKTAHEVAPSTGADLIVVYCFDCIFFEARQTGRERPLPAALTGCRRPA